MKTKMMLSAMLVGFSMLTFAQTRSTGNEHAVTVIKDENGNRTYGQAVSDRPKVLMEHRFKKTTGTLSIEAGLVSLEGYKGDEVIISRMVETREPKENNDPRAAGLEGIGESGFYGDHKAGIGLNIQQEGDLTEIRRGQMATNNDTIFVKVPEHLHVIIKKTTFSALFFPGNQGDITVKNISGELEITSASGHVKLDNITGPLTVKAMGNIEAAFRSPVKGPVSLITSMGFVDVALPLTTKARLNMIAAMGELYASKDFNIEVITEEITGETDQTVADDSSLASREFYRALSLQAVPSSIFDRFGNSAYPGIGSRVIGTINGGGEDIILRTTQGKIYLRKAEK